jgi:hypothetical protein
MLNKQKPTGKKRLQGSAVDPVEFARVQRGLSEAKKELETLYAALDNVESGLLVLNKDMRAVYGNPVLHVMFKANSSQEIRETNFTASGIFRAWVMRRRRRNKGIG